MDEVRIGLRLPADLHVRIVELARQEQRSLNGQLVYLLRKSLD